MLFRVVVTCVFDQSVLLIKLTVRSYRIPRLSSPCPFTGINFPRVENTLDRPNPTRWRFYHFLRIENGSEVQNVFKFVFYTHILSHTFLTVGRWIIFKHQFVSATTKYFTCFVVGFQKYILYLKKESHYSTHYFCYKIMINLIIWTVQLNYKLFNNVILNTNM